MKFGKLHMKLTDLLSCTTCTISPESSTPLRGQKISHWRGVRLRATRFPGDCEQGRNFGLALRRSGENVLRVVESTNMAPRIPDVQLICVVGPTE
jgi:hypothetical protein